jgi:hypothetical protein
MSGYESIFSVQTFVFLLLTSLQIALQMFCRMHFVGVEQN